MSDAIPFATAVFDTGIVLQAALSDEGHAFDCLTLMEQGQITVFLSPQLREEYADVLTRPAIRAKNPILDEERAQQVLARIDAKTQSVTVIRPHVRYSRDPDDEPILNLAIQEKVNYLVARDRDLLDLGRDTDFRLLYPDLRIVDPLTFLRQMSLRQVRGSPLDRDSHPSTEMGPKSEL